MLTDKRGTGIFDLTGRRVLVTGASRGIGQAIAVGLSACGADVFCVARSGDGLAETLRLIKEVNQGPAVAHTADLRSEQSIQETVAAMVEQVGGIDVLVNNAADDHESSIEDTDLVTWRRVLELNLDSCFLLCRTAGPHLQAGEGGKVINVASVLGQVAVRDNSAYIAAKSGLVGFTQALSLEWARKGVQVNSLAPGFIRTEMTHHVWSDERANAWIIRRTPMGRWGEPNDLVGATVFLASSASSFVTGHCLCVDGGWTAQ